MLSLSVSGASRESLCGGSAGNRKWKPSSSVSDRFSQLHKDGSGLRFRLWKRSRFRFTLSGHLLVVVDHVQWIFFLNDNIKSEDELFPVD